VLLPVTVVRSIGCGGLAPMHICVFEVGKLCCVFDQTSRNCLVKPTVHTCTSISPAYCSYQTCHIWKISCFSSKWVWYIHSPYTRYSWPVALTLFRSLVVLMTYFPSCNTHLRTDMSCEIWIASRCALLGRLPPMPFQRRALHTMYYHQKVLGALHG